MSLTFNYRNHYQGGEVTQKEVVFWSPRTFIQSLVSIVDKDRHTVPFLFNPPQAVYYIHRTKRDIILKPRQLGFCLDAKTRILTADLEWVALKDIKEGQKIVATDESLGGFFKTKKGGRKYSRKLRTTTVEKKRSVFEVAIKITMDDGRELIATPQHRFLSKLHKAGQYCGWRCVKDFKIGDEIRYITKPWETGNLEDGWFGGMIDGEGSIKYKNHPAVEVSVSQSSDSKLFREMELYAERNGYNYGGTLDQRKHSDGDTSKFGDKPIGCVRFSRMDEIFKLVGKSRPKKLIGVHWWEGKDLPGKGSGIGWAKVVGIEQLPPQEMIDLQTSERTYIAEGFVSHNSILVSGLFLHDTMFTPNTTSVVVAHTQKDSISLFERARFMFNSIPEEFKPEVQYSSRMELTFGAINSKFIIGSAEAKEFGRGRTINNLHLSEVSAPAYSQDFIDGIFEAVPKNGWIVLESTARGEGGPFYDTYIGATNLRYPLRKFNNEFTAHYYRWFEDPEYQETIYPDENFELTPEEDDLVQRFGLTLEQMKWRRIKRVRLRAKFVQEYPELDDTDAFIKSGTPVFDVELLSEIDKRIPDQIPQEIWLGGDLYIYEVARAGGEYVIGVDPAEGDARSNNSVAIVCRVKPLPVEQVALLVGKWTPDMLSEKAYRMGKAYNDALIAVERNNHGHAVIQALTNGITRRGQVIYPPYPNIYIGPDKKAGWLTGNLTKPQMIDELDKAIRNGEIIIVSKRFIEEAKRFVFSKTGMGSKLGDDIVMGQAVALMAIMTGGFTWFF